ESCIGVANGTDALEIAMRALVGLRGQGGTEVITVANAGGYSTAACRLVGLTPVYADIEEASQLVSLPSVVAALGEQTALVIVTHLYGGLVDVGQLRAMMDKAGYRYIPILEDCAQAHGLRLGSRMAGSLGDIAAFSFYPTKNLGAFGDGGAIATSDPELAQRCQMLRQYGWASKYAVAMPGGRNSRLDEVQAAILHQLLPHLDVANARRVEILNRYAAAAPTGVKVARAEASVAHLAVVLCDDRAGLQSYLADRGIQTDIHYPVLDCDQPGWSELPWREAPGGLGVARASVGKLLTLPCFPALTDDETG
ncbi:DegT/DnrJ/EryC1/StrS family aminotransferase, partial [Rhodoplanes sp. SY1]|uniref:DegT/DnrJ/EryC1/StrS family aminotransferase n=1 Tax=Rhodoplanes sp. SY1 TaxID=3166646 RepID=UPI0038B57917